MTTAHAHTHTHKDNTRILISQISTLCHTPVSMFGFHQRNMYLEYSINTTSYNLSVSVCMCHKRIHIYDCSVRLYVCVQFVWCFISNHSKLTGKLLNCELQRNRFPLSISTIFIENRYL